MHDPVPTFGVARALGDLRERVVFVGGAIVPIPQTDPPFREARITSDVDAIIATVSDTAAQHVQPQHPRFAHPDPPRPQPRPDLPMPLAAERARGDHRADRGEQLSIVQRRPRTAFAAREGGTGMSPYLAIVALRAPGRVVWGTGLP
jgi:hypothetical protein